MRNILEIKDLSVAVSGKLLLKNINLDVPEGEIYALFGPNGSGKTTLIKVIVGLSGYDMVSGKIFFKGKDITNLPINERVKMGLGIAFQSPPKVMGVKLGMLLNMLTSSHVKAEDIMHNLRIPIDFLDRSINDGFSGGETKKSELLQVMIQNPDLVMLDEPDSGVDVENLEVIGKALKKFLERKSGLIVTHLGYVLKYVKASKAYVLYDGEMICCGNPSVVLKQIEREGYSKCGKCLITRKKQEKL